MEHQAKSDLELVLAGSSARVEHWSRERHLVTPGAATSFAANLSVPAADNLIQSIEPLIHTYSNLAQMVVRGDYPTAASFLHLEVASVVASPWFGSSGSYTSDLTLGLTARFRTWVFELKSAVPVEGQPNIQPLEPHPSTDWRPIPDQAVAYVATAALDRLATESKAHNYQYKLDRVQSILGLSPAEMARTLGVSDEGYRKWMRGAQIADKRLSDIDDLYDFCLWLLRHIVPESIPSFIRRRIPALSGQTPFDWLTAKRLPELRKVYERAFSYEHIA